MTEYSIEISFKFYQDFYLKSLILNTGNGTTPGATTQAGSYVGIYVNGTLIYYIDMAGVTPLVNVELTDFYESVLQRKGEYGEIKFVFHVHWGGTSSTFSATMETRGYSLHLNG